MFAFQGWWWLCSVAFDRIDISNIPPLEQNLLESLKSLWVVANYYLFEISRKGSAAEILNIFDQSLCNMVFVSLFYIFLKQIYPPLNFNRAPQSKFQSRVYKISWNIWLPQSDCLFFESAQMHSNTLDRILLLTLSAFRDFRNTLTSDFHLKKILKVSSHWKNQENNQNSQEENKSSSFNWREKLQSDSTFEMKKEDFILSYFHLSDSL